MVPFSTAGARANPNLEMITQCVTDSVLQSLMHTFGDDYTVRVLCHWFSFPCVACLCHLNQCVLFWMQRNFYHVTLSHDVKNVMHGRFTKQRLIPWCLLCIVYKIHKICAIRIGINELNSYHSSWAPICNSSWSCSFCILVSNPPPCHRSLKTGSAFLLVRSICIANKVH